MPQRSVISLTVILLRARSFRSRNILDCYFAQGALIQELNKGFSYHPFCNIHIRHRILAPFAQMIL